MRWMRWNLKWRWWCKVAWPLSKAPCVSCKIFAVRAVVPFHVVNFLSLGCISLKCRLLAYVTVTEYFQIESQYERIDSAQNIGDSIVGALSWWLIGYGVAFGNDYGGFIGCSGYALKGEREFGTLSGEYDSRSYALWLFQWAFAATSTTIVSGAMAERATFGAYAGYSILITILICKSWKARRYMRPLGTLR